MMKQGDRFGKLVAFQPASKNIKRQPTWIFECDCGRVVVRPTYYFREETKSSCGECFKYTKIGWMRVGYERSKF